VIRRTVALAVLALLVPASADAANPRPKTIPALRTWNGGEDSYRLRHSIRIVMAGATPTFLDEAVTADPSRVNGGSTEGPQTAATAGTAESANMAL
jgi:hypothetical protein